jgi:anti-anti-sigma factor
MDTRQLRVETIGDVTVVHYSGTAGEPLPPEVGLMGLLERGVKKLAIDLEGIAFLSSSNLGALILLQRKAHEMGVKYRIGCPAKGLRDVFEITKLDLLFPVYTSLNNALDGF